jgi:nicotinamide riboside kinase
MGKLIVVNLFGAPSTGKSALRAHLFGQMKWNGISCEESYEYVKARVWEDSLNSIKNQIYIFGKQHNQLFRLRDKVDVAITDAPLMNSILYDKNNDELFRKLVHREFETYDNLNFVINRSKPYDPKGRYQTEKEADAVGEDVLKILDNYDVKYQKIPGGPDSVQSILDVVINRLSEVKDIIHIQK